MKRIMQIAAILVASVLLSGCNRPQTVNKAELDKAKAEWQEPKISIWYYVGSKDGYHHYLHRDLPGDKLYQVSERELNQGNPFPVTRNQKKWKVMPWGVHAPRDRQE